MKTKLLCIMFCVGLISLPGCGGPPPDEKIPVQTTAIIESVKKTLQSFEKTGQTGSALTSLESEINGIKSSDPAKGDALHKAYLELQSISAPDKVKAKAKEMLAILK